MIADKRAKLPTTEKTVDQLQAEFRVVNDEAMEIQTRMVAVSEQIARRSDRKSADPAMTDTVEF